jgi:hypothetical protein
MKAPAIPRTGFHNARELTWTLAWLRLCAVGGQALTVAVVAFGMHLPIPVNRLALGIGALLAFALAVFWRLGRAWRVTSPEAVAHIAVDIAALGWLLYLTGGATNPFVSLLVLPITLAAAALPLRDVAIVAMLAAIVYLALIPWHVPLPMLHASGDFNLHVLGMAINFVIMAAALSFFVTRLARLLRARESEIQRERERALREAAASRHAVVILEAPHRIAATAMQIAAAFDPARRAIVVREVTKKFESIIATRVEDLSRAIEADTARGEYVLLIDGAAAAAADDIDALTRRWLQALVEEIPASRAAAIAARVTGLPRARLYDAAIGKPGA